MSSGLRWLLWAAALVIGLNSVLDVRDQLSELAVERKAAEALKSREATVTSGLNWSEEVERARLVRAEWMDRVPLYATRGLLNAGVMESMGAICSELKLACQVALTDNMAAVSKPAPVPSTSTVGNTARDVRRISALPKNLTSARLKLTVAFQPEDLVKLVRRLESADQLRTIERVAISGPRMEFTVRVYAVEASDPAPVAAAKSGAPS